MIRPAVILVPFALVACAPRGRVVPLSPIPQARLGSPSAFGPGILSATPHDLRLGLARPGHVIVLHVGPAADVQVVRSGRRLDVGIHKVTRRIDARVVSRSVTQASSDPMGTGERPRDCELRADRVRSTAPRDSLGNASTQADMEADAVYRSCLARLSPSRGTSRVTTVYERQPDLPGGYWLVIVSDVDPGKVTFPRTIGFVEDGKMVEVLLQLPNIWMESRTTSWAAYLAAIPVD